MLTFLLSWCLGIGVRLAPQDSHPAPTAVSVPALGTRPNGFDIRLRFRPGQLEKIRATLEGVRRFVRV